MPPADLLRLVSAYLGCQAAYSSGVESFTSLYSRVCSPDCEPGIYMYDFSNIKKKSIFCVND